MRDFPMDCGLCKIFRQQNFSLASRLIDAGADSERFDALVAASVDLA